MRDAITNIEEWAKNLPYWEQVTLDKILSDEDFTEEDYELIFNYMLEDEGLSTKTYNRGIPRFYKKLEIFESSNKPKRLLQISQLTNINALACNQTLTFNPMLTVIYGENGSGKSGYSRVLGCVGFTRGDREVLPDVTKFKSGSEPLTAEIEYLDDGTPKKILYMIGDNCPELSSFYVFDSTSVKVHMSGKNDFSFTPVGLNYLKRMADETDQIRARLHKIIEAYEQPCEYKSRFLGDSEVKNFMDNLGPESDLNKLEELISITEDQKKQHQELAIQVANFKLKKVDDQISFLEQDINILDIFLDQLQNILLNLSENQVCKINNAIKHYLMLSEKASQSSLSQFQNVCFNGTGSSKWQLFIEAAKNWANSATVNPNSYPEKGDLCLLCHQSLSEEGLLLLHQLWDYLEGKDKESLNISMELLKMYKLNLENIGVLNNETDLSNFLKTIKKYDENLLNEVCKFIDTFKKFYSQVRQGIDNLSEINLAPFPSNCVDKIESLLALKREELQRLMSSNIDDVEKEKRELDHRILLEPLYKNIKLYIENRKWAKTAEGAGGSTHHITIKQNELFKELVTEEYIRVFEETLLNMGRPLKVKVSTSGQKGVTMKQIIFNTASDVRDKNPEKILSEGEKRAVALADFLTEATLDLRCNGLILDDPVTSLDLEWRQIIADMLVKKAKKHQIIIFTHDLPFLYYLKEKSSELQIDISCHWIQRGGEDNRPGFVYLNNSPALEKEYKKPNKAKSYYSLAKDCSNPQQQEALIKDGFGALRTTYEAFIMFELLNGVISRFSERISPGSLRDICWDQDIVDKIRLGYERLSRKLEGHLHSDTFTDKRATPEELNLEIQQFEELQGKLKELKKIKSSI